MTCPICSLSTERISQIDSLLCLGTPLQSVAESQGVLLTDLWSHWQHLAGVCGMLGQLIQLETFRTAHLRIATGATATDAIRIKALECARQISIDIMTLAAKHADRMLASSKNQPQETVSTEELEALIRTVRRI